MGFLRVMGVLLRNNNLGEGSHAIVMSSISGSVELTSPARSMFLPYKMSKAALNMALKTVSAWMEPYGIICTALHPGFVQTDMILRAIESGAVPEEVGKGAMSPSECARKCTDT